MSTKKQAAAPRGDHRDQFIGRAWDNIDKANRLIGLRLDIADVDFAYLQELLERLIEDPATEDAELKKTLKSMTKAIEKLGAVDVRALTSAISTLYDKTALAQGEATERYEVTADDIRLMAAVERIYNRVLGEDKKHIL